MIWFCLVRLHILVNLISETYTQESCYLSSHAIRLSLVIKLEITNLTFYDQELANNVTSKRVVKKAVVKTTVSAHWFPSILRHDLTVSCYQYALHHLFPWNLICVYYLIKSVHSIRLGICYMISIFVWYSPCQWKTNPLKIFINLCCICNHLFKIFI